MHTADQIKNMTRPCYKIRLRYVSTDGKLMCRCTIYFAVICPDMVQEQQRSTQQGLITANLEINKETSVPLRDRLPPLSALLFIGTGWRGGSFGRIWLNNDPPLLYLLLCRAACSRQRVFGLKKEHDVSQLISQLRHLLQNKPHCLHHCMRQVHKLTDCLRHCTSQCQCQT